MKTSVVIDAMALAGLALFGASIFQVSRILFVLLAGASLFALSVLLARRESRRHSQKEGN